MTKLLILTVMFLIFKVSDQHKNGRRNCKLQNTAGNDTVNIQTIKRHCSYGTLTNNFSGRRNRKLQSTPGDDTANLQTIKRHGSNDQTILAKKGAGRRNHKVQETPASKTDNFKSSNGQRSHNQRTLMNISGGKQDAQQNTNGNDTANPRTFVGQPSHDQRSLMENITVESFPEFIQTKLKVESQVVEYFTGQLSTQIIPAFYIFTMIVGIPTHLVTLWILGRKISISSTAIFYFSLALSDFLLLVTLSFKVHYHLNGNNWIFGEVMCKVVTASFYGNIYCSIHNLMCISINRYLAIVQPFIYRSLSKRACTIWSCVLVWIVVSFATVPELLVTQSYSVSEVNITTCHDVRPSEDRSQTFLFYYYLGLISFGFFIPFAVTTFSYVSIINELHKSNQDYCYYIKTSTLVFIIFTVCFTPSNVIYFLHYIKLYFTSQDYFYMYYSIAACLCSFHSCLDPFLFFFMSQSKYLHLTSVRQKWKDFSNST
ncbi:proteinase-activated receptor 3 isoform X1 [Lepisosteus oculatus]|uniref:proteinase-activated receptor 3 isoform X1 n=1 Tax=Lepisosteus oculatus TaxID=7918 RepID=UPI0037203E1B